MEKPNVNNLNGVPNFGHGFDDVVEVIEEETVPIETEEPSIDEVEEDDETEDKSKKKKK